MQHLQPNTTLQGGKYRIERVLGQGGFGITYLAVQISDNRQVAIKELFLNGVNERVGTVIQVSNSANDTLFEKQKEKFKKEAKRIMSLDNEHIVKVYALFEENNTVYYVMDYLEGESLATKMKREGHPLTESEVMDILPQLLDALSEIHKFQIWHLDIKPANIMLIDKTVVLIDFGASKQITPSEMTSTALYFTPGYAPAEQTGMLFNQFGPWTDLYAVGATIFNLLTGKSPLEFDIEEFKEDDLPESNLGLMYKMINWMMQPRRKDRPQKAEDVKQKYYVDLVSIGVISIAKEVFNKEIVKTKGEDIDFVKDLGATKNQIDVIQKEIKELFGADVEGYPMTHDCIVVAILQQLGWLFDFSGRSEEEATDEDAEELENLVKEQNKILEDRNEETVVSGGGKVDNNMTVEEMVSLINSDNQKGLETVRGIANSGNADAQLLVGIMYHMGIAGEEHQSDAAYYFRMAAEQGLASAQTNLGKCYLAGDGVPEDDKKAFEWFEKAARQGDAEGQFQLGRCYEEGWGTEKIENLAYQYYSKSANQGYVNAQIQVGFCYLDGIGVSANDSGAFEWFKKAAEQDNPDGQYLLGVCYSEGTGVVKNQHEAVKWYKKAAEQGVAGAQYNLGVCYLEGDGVPQNRSEAKRLFQKAVEQGHEDAKKALQYIEQQTNQNSSYTNNLSGDESTIIDRSPQNEKVYISDPQSYVTSPVENTSAVNVSTSQEGNSSNLFWIIVIVVAVIIGLYYLFTNKSLSHDDETVDNSMQVEQVVGDMPNATYENATNPVEAENGNEIENESETGKMSSIFQICNISEMEGTCEISSLSKSVTGELIIPDFINGYRVIGIVDYAFRNCQNISSVVIPPSIDKIREGTFYGCTQLTSVSIPNSISSIGAWAFADCKSLKNISIPGSVNKIGVRCFSGCSSLIALSLPNSINALAPNTFDGCTSLTSLTIPEGVQTLTSEVFNGCIGLRTIILPSSLNGIGNSNFKGCTSLEKVISKMESPCNYYENEFNNCYLVVPYGTKEMYEEKGYNKHFSAIVEQ